MNEVHKAHVASERAAGRVSVLNYHDISAPKETTSEPKPSAVNVIAHKLWGVVRW